MEMNQTGQDMNKGKVCNCPHHKVVPIIIIVVGIVIIWAGYGGLSFQIESLVVGILTLAAGFTKLFGRKCGCC